MLVAAQEDLVVPSLHQRASANAARAVAADPFGLPHSGYLGAISSATALATSSTVFPCFFSSPARACRLWRTDGPGQSGQHADAAVGRMTRWFQGGQLLERAQPPADAGLWTGRETAAHDVAGEQHAIVLNPDQRVAASVQWSGLVKSRT